MKILLLGANGTIGKAIYHNLNKHGHEIIKAGISSGDVLVDATSQDSIKQMFETIGKVDAVISAAGLPLTFKPLAEMTPEDYASSFTSKGLGQIQLALIAQNYLNDGGSITLTSGVLTDNFIKAGSAGSMVNSAVNGFVKGAAFELPRGIRMNVVSPALLEESLDVYGDFFPGAETVTAAKVARAYERSALGIETGKVFAVV